MQNILATIDFSERSLVAAHRAAVLAAAHGAGLTLLHIVEEGASSAAASEALRLASEQQERMARELAQEHGVKCALKVDNGAAWDTVLFHAEQLKADLIVMGRHRESAWKEVFRGTTVDRVVRHSRIPVLVAVSETVVPYQRVVVGVDFSDSSKEALRIAHRLAPEARMDAIHAQEPESAHGMAVQDEASVAEMMRTLVRDHLPGVAVETSVKEGWPYRLFSKAAANDGRKLLALGTHTRSGFGSAVLGGVTESCLAEPFCDLLLVPPT